MDMNLKNKKKGIKALAIGDKRGMVFTLLSLVIAGFLAVMFSADFSTPEDLQMALVENRIGMLKFYIDSFYSYAQAAGSITGYSAISSELRLMNMTPKGYRPDFELELINCTLYGIINSTYNCTNMTNATILYFLDRMNILAMSEFKINSQYVINDLRVSQENDPFIIDLTFNLTLNVSDPFANISTTRSFTSQVNINGLQDPLYTVNGTYYQVINKSNLSSKRQGNWTPDDLQNIYAQKTYRPFVGGVSFINRMKGNFTNSSMGIESFVRTTVFTGADLNYSAVDYLYWQKIPFRCDNGEVVFINETAIPLVDYPPRLQLDEAHRMIFFANNVSNIYAFRTC